MQGIKDLMQREMTRKEFLIFVGMAIVTAMGLANAMRIVTGKELTLPGMNEPRNGTYGNKKPGAGTQA